jgi:hypothetical protein
MGKFGPSNSRYEDCRLAGVAKIVLQATRPSSFLIVMQLTVTAISGLAANTIVKYADAPWVLFNPSEALPVRTLVEPAPVTAKRSVTETKKQEERRASRQARRVKQQPNPF